MRDLRIGNLCRRGWVAHHGPNLPGHGPGRATCPKKSKSEQNGSNSGTLGNLKCIEASSEKAKESCTYKSTVVANTSHPDILGLTQHYAGGNEKEESPYGGKNCFCSVPGMVAKLRPTKGAKYSQKICMFCGKTLAHQVCVEAGEE